MISDVKSVITSITKNFLNILYPLHCATCKRVLSPLNELGICDFCRGRIRQNPKPYNIERGPEKRFFSEAYSACLYEGILKELIRLFKYKRKILYSRILSNLMIDFVNDNREIIDGINLVTFVPLERKRLREREFNQSKILAFNLSNEFGLPLKDILDKITATRHQNELTRDERVNNLRGVFKIKKGSDIKGLKVLLIDDVMTTSTTLNECSRVLLEAGANKVRCFTLAR